MPRVPNAAEPFYFSRIPSKYVARDGRHIPARTKAQWLNAMKGHTRSAHHGKEDPTCAACRELRREINAA